MNLETAWSLPIGNGGWVLVRGRDVPTPVYVRFARGETGRLEAVELYITGDGQLDAGFLRRLPLATIEAFANEPDVRKAIIEKLHLPGPDLRRLAANFAHTFGPRAVHWVARSLRAQVKGSGEPQAPMPRREPWRPTRIEAPPLKFDVPSTVPYPDSFYQQVADAYSFLVLVSPRPSVVLADENGVPVTTTRRWVKEARRRGLLAPGQQGRRG